ncbi:cyclin-like protein [Geopyxis carbonaria]|nr:cyclin-like protein [Geopyxis carbonaria]
MPAYEDSKQLPPPPPPPLRTKPRTWSTQLPSPPPTRDKKMSAPPSEWESSQWLFTEEELLQTPSVLDGITPEQEREQRSKGCNFIIQLGIQLKLPQLTLATASTYLHRFYMQNSLKKNHYYEVAATSLFLATKVEENMRKFADIVVACVRAAQKNLQLEVHRDDKEFWRWKDCILLKEDQLLESICFDVTVEVPYNHLLHYTSQLGVQTRQLIRTAWTFLNDATLTMLCILYPPRTIAAAALYCAAKHCQIEFPDQDGKPWWEVIGVRMKDIKRCCNYMALVYENNPLRGEDRPRYVATPEGGPETTKTRARCYSSLSPDPRDSPPEKRARTQSTGSRDDDDRKRLRVGNKREKNGTDIKSTPRAEGTPLPPPPLNKGLPPKPVQPAALDPKPQEPKPQEPKPQEAKPVDSKPSSQDPDLEEGELDD